jgi:hypothetical protein
MENPDNAKTAEKKSILTDHINEKLINYSLMDIVNYKTKINTVISNQEVSSVALENEAENTKCIY